MMFIIFNILTHICVRWAHVKRKAYFVGWGSAFLNESAIKEIKQLGLEKRMISSASGDSCQQRYGMNLLDYYHAAIVQFTFN